MRISSAIALGLVIVALMFTSHFIFNVEEATGVVCKESAAIASLSDDKDLSKKENNFGLGSCLAANIASCRMNAATSKMEPSCTGRRQPVCSEGTATCDSAGLPMCKYGPAVCAAACEEKTVVLDIKSACQATKVWLEEEQQYTITVVPESPVWKDGEKRASARGYNISELPDLWDRVIAVLTWPLKRDYSQPTFRVTARVGSTGGNVEFLVPDPISKERTIDKLTADDVRLEETIRPKSSGELFLYVNEAVLPSPWLRHVFYRNNTGSANVTIRRKRL
jgi:hypothetical protein